MAHETTGFAPFYLMFGRFPRLAVDLLFKNVLRDETFCDYDAYVKSLASDFHSAMLLSQKNSAIEQKHQYNKSTTSTTKRSWVCLSPSVTRLLWQTRVAEESVSLLTNGSHCSHSCGLQALSTIRDRVGHERVVHRNVLLQVSFLPLDESLDILGVGSVYYGCPMHRRRLRRGRWGRVPTRFRQD